ncbi:MAG: methyltransferase family protein [Terriglobales bacterium]
MIAASFVMRGAPKARVTSFTARLSAYAVTALVPAYLALAPQFVPVDVPVVLRWISLAMWLIGCLLGLWGIWNLRYSFSIEPQARQLVTAGPYRYVRHPMYASYVLQYGAILLGRFSLGFALVMAAWLLLLWARMQFEETVLSAAFPGYEDYRRRVGALVPRFASREAPLAVPADSGRALEVQQWG